MDDPGLLFRQNACNHREFVEPECSCISKRYIIGILTCFGFIISFGMRCNMPIAKASLEYKTFNWAAETDAGIDSVFFWGYVLTLIPGGILASAYPAYRIFGFAIACSSLLNLFLPSAIDFSPTVVIIIRLHQGLFEGAAFPACYGIWRSWAPPLERSRLATLAFCGSYAGLLLGMPLNGILSSGIGWRSTFYFYGLFGIIWYLFWLYLTFETPANHPTISARELAYIEQSLGASVNVAMPKISAYPWRYIFTSMPVYAILVANFCRSWNFYFLLLFQSDYFLQLFKLQILELASLPILIMTVIVPSGGILADYFRKKSKLSTTNIRKLFNCGGFGMEAICFIVIAYSTNAFTSIMALNFGMLFSGLSISGFNVNHLDIAPRYASILLGMSNCIGSLAGLLCPIVIDHIMYESRIGNWKIVFLLAAFVQIFGAMFYAIFASGEIQNWAEPTQDRKIQENMMTPPPEAGSSIPVDQEHKFDTVELNG